MARGNRVYMMGKVISRPVIKLDKDGEYVSGRLEILTARRSGLSPKSRLAGEARSDEQLIQSRDPYVIEHKMAVLEEGDIIFLVGTLSTREVIKKMRCPHCSEIAQQSAGVIVYVDPIAIIKVMTTKDMSEEEVAQFLISNAELSNYAMFFGSLVREPRYAPDFGGTTRREANIQIALNRKRLIPEDGPDKTTDYPYVRAFGKIAEESAKVLHTGSEIYIEGAIETRQIVLKKTCPECGMDFEVDSSAVEIVPYSVEYINNVDVSILKTPEELEDSTESLQRYMMMKEEYPDISEDDSDEISDDGSDDYEDNDYEDDDYEDDEDDEDNEDNE